jgi:hypothetical protein
MQKQRGTPIGGLRSGDGSFTMEWRAELWAEPRGMQCDRMVKQMGEEFLALYAFEPLITA